MLTLARPIELQSALSEYQASTFNGLPSNTTFVLAIPVRIPGAVVVTQPARAIPSTANVPEKHSKAPSLRKHRRV
jgi:hypothetical protein